MHLLTFFGHSFAFVITGHFGAVLALVASHIWLISSWNDNFSIREDVPSTSHGAAAVQRRR